MPRGRPVNLDKRVALLVGQLKATLVARARLRIEAQVDERVASLVGGLQSVVEANGVPAAAEVAAPAPTTGKRTRSAASRAAQAAKMRAYWKQRKAGKGAKAAAPTAKRGSRTAGQRGPGKGNTKLKSAVKASWANYTPAQRAARIAAMKAGHAKRKRARAKK